VRKLTAKDHTPSPEEIKAWNANLNEAVNPDLSIAGASGNDLKKLSQTIASGDVDKAKQQVNDIFSQTALGSLAANGVSDLVGVVSAIAKNDVTRISKDNAKPGELEGDQSDFLQATSDPHMTAYANKYIHFKNKLKDCYDRGDQKCVQEVSKDVTEAAEQIRGQASYQFNEIIKDNNKDIDVLKEWLQNDNLSVEEKNKIQNKINELDKEEKSIKKAEGELIKTIYPKGEDLNLVAQELEKQRKETGLSKQEFAKQTNEYLKENPLPNPSFSNNFDYEDNFNTIKNALETVQIGGPQAYQNNNVSKNNFTDKPILGLSGWEDASRNAKLQNELNLGQMRAQFNNTPLLSDSILSTVTSQNNTSTNINSNIGTNNNNGANVNLHFNGSYWENTGTVNNQPQSHSKPKKSQSQPQPQSQQPRFQPQPQSQKLPLQNVHFGGPRGW
jgi:hypothetical protein